MKPGRFRLTPGEHRQLEQEADAYHVSYKPGGLLLVEVRDTGGTVVRKVRRKPFRVSWQQSRMFRIAHYGHELAVHYDFCHWVIDPSAMPEPRLFDACI